MMITLSEDREAEITLDWSLAKLKKPSIKCHDDRFRVLNQTHGSHSTKIRISADKGLKSTDLAFATEIMFSVWEGEREFLVSVPLRRSGPRVILPASIILDTKKTEPMKFVIVTDSSTVEDKTGRCRLRSSVTAHECVIPGTVSKENPSSVVTSFALADRTLTMQKKDSTNTLSKLMTSSRTRD
ncbi:MAG: hypothetical protein ABL921_32220 [Pirellula sp.]